MYLQNVIMFFVSLLLFASCMGEGSNTATGTLYGVVRMDNNTLKKVLDVNEYESLYSPTILNNRDLGACLFVYYEVDYDLPDNSPENIEANGYLTVTYMQVLVEGERQDMWYNMDTSNILHNEVAINDPASEGVFAYVKGRGFFWSVVTIPSDQKMSWYLSCDIQNVEKNEHKTYDVFLRCTAEDVGTKPIEQEGFLNAYNMKLFLETIARQEKDLGSGNFTLRINYVSAVNDEQLTWDYKDISIPVDYILSAE